MGAYSSRWLANHEAWAAVVQKCGTQGLMCSSWSRAPTSLYVASTYGVQCLFSGPPMTWVEGKRCSDSFDHMFQVRLHVNDK